MSIIKNIKKYPNGNIEDTLSFIPRAIIKNNYSPFKLSNKNSLRNTLDKLNSKTKKNNSTKKTKNKSKDSDILLNNYLSQRPRVNTEGNDINLTKMKFSKDFFKNRIDQIFKINNNKNNTNKKSNTKNNYDNNFRAAKKNNIETVNQIKNQNNSNNLNKKNNTNFHFTRFAGNNANSYNKKIIEKSSNNEYNNTNTQNFSQTQSYFNQNNKKKNNTTNNNQLFFGNSDNIKYKNTNKSEDIKKRSFVNNKIVKESKMKNFSGLLQQISPLYVANNKLSHIQNYFKNIHKNKKIINNQKTQHSNKEKKVLTTEPKDLNNTNRMDTEEFILKDNSNYLVVTKNPTQITNIIEKKENNKYINNFFNICESTNMTNKKVDYNKDDDKSNFCDENEYDTYEEIHFYFIRKIQKGKQIKLNMNNKKS